MKIVIDLELSSAQKRIIRAAVVLGAVAGALGVGVAIAAPKHTFTEGQRLSSQQLNQSLVDLDDKIAAVSAKVVRGRDGAQISGGPVYVAKTAPTDGRFIDPTTNQPNGFRAAKRLCEKAANSPTAHMCDQSEMVRSDQLGVFVAPLVGNDEELWVAGAQFSPSGFNAGNVRDCLSFSIAVAGEYAGTWRVNSKTGVPVAGTAQNGIQLCTNQFPIACCD